MTYKVSINIGAHGRDPQKTRELIAKAARIKGISASQFCLAVVVKAASAIVTREQKNGVKGG